ncbi:glycosyltransferase family 2 protein [Jannaschia formosa]|uniref:glycosyltransferase family 2 protein n=1 Tax=Jannaschia formosa TaxID=2259592 RepID=UPI000E1BC202|nr:glycosyltransferase family A protein [Jannaschia formosa]TFL17129.1 glycosyltransferase family 2 protein [Jannaschia formosa]
MSRVAVVVPCRDRAATVGEAVASVLAQDYPDLEVVAVDDGSGDGTVAVLEAIADPRLRVLRNPGPPGVSGARNHGVAATEAPWIAFQDSDDLWRPGKLRRQMARLAEGGHVAAYCAMEVSRDPGSPAAARIPAPDHPGPLEGDILPALAQGSFVSTQTLVLRRDVFAAAGGFDTGLRALVDWELMLRVAQAGPVAFVDAPLVVQRMQPNSITRSATARLAAQMRILDRHGALLARYPGALARHHDRLAGGHRRAGDWAAAAHHAGQAARLAPGPRSLGKAVWLAARARLAGGRDGRRDDPVP